MSTEEGCIGKCPLHTSLGSVEMEVESKADTTMGKPFPTQAKVSSFELRIKNCEIFGRNLVDYTHYSIEDDIPGFASAVIIIEHNSLCGKDLDYESCLGEAIGE